MINNKKDKIGSIYYDKKDKKWKCTYYVTDRDTLKEKRKYKSFSTEKEAKEFLTGIQFQRRNVMFIKNNGIPLNQLMREITQRKFDMNLISGRTYARLMRTIKSIEKSPIARENIDNIKSEEIQDYMTTLKDYSDSVIKKIQEQLNQTFKYAINKGYMVRNPMIDVIRPKSNKVTKKVRALEVEEQQKLTNYLMSIPVTEEPYKLAYLIQMYLGLRIGETLALRSTDIDLRRNLISVNKTLTTDKDNKIIMGNSTKTYAGLREVPIPTFIRNEVINQMRLAENNKDRQLFVSSKGDYVRPCIANRRLKDILKKMEIHDISSHSLRHTYRNKMYRSRHESSCTSKINGTYRYFGYFKYIYICF